MEMLLRLLPHLRARNYRTLAGWSRRWRTSSRFNITNLALLLEDVHERLAGVVDREPALAAPASIATTGRRCCSIWTHSTGAARPTTERTSSAATRSAWLADRLGRLADSFILSTNDVPQIRELFAGFDFKGVAVDYSLQGGRPTKARELIISGRRG